LTPDDEAEFTDAARARVALAAAARTLSDDARNLVETSHETSHEAVHDLIDEANRLVGQVGELLKLAVIHARERHMSWGDIGKALDVTRQTAHQRYAGDLAEWRDALYDPARHDYGWMPEGAYNPGQVVPGLDAWLVQHHTGNGEPGSVSAGLPRYDARRRVLEALARATWMSERIKAGAPIPPEAQSDHHRRQEIAAAAAAAATETVRPPA
jgi:hypothetical protein